MKAIKSMECMEYVIGTFDYSQISTELKYQSGGHSSTVTLVTSRMFINATVLHGLSLLRFPNVRPDIIYLDQTIPSAFGMPAYKDIGSITPDAYSNLKYQTVDSTMDITGALVERYAKMVLVAQKLKMFRRIIPFWCGRFQFQNDKHYLSMTNLNVIERLKPSGWILQVGDQFQPNAVRVWRNGGNITEASALLPPVSPYEELMKRGAGQNITSMLLIRGILVPIECAGAAGSISKIRLAPDYKNKWLMLVGDGLTQIWIKSFVDEINKSCYDFGDQQEALALIKEALG